MHTEPYSPQMIILPWRALEPMSVRSSSSMVERFHSTLLCSSAHNFVSDERYL